MNLKVLDEKFKVIKLNAKDKIPEQVFKQEIYSITRTDEELSIVVNTNIEIKSDIIEYGWRAIKIVGTLDFSLTGILSKISTILANINISIFVISTYNTDYILLKKDKLQNAVDVLKENDYNFV